MTTALRVEPPWDARLARTVARAIAPRAVTPNTITAIGLAVGLGGAALFALGGEWARWGAIGFAISFFLDHVDGELARLTEQSSRFGHYFDVVAGGLVIAGTFIGMGIGIGGFYSNVAGVLAGFTIAVIFAVRLELERRNGSKATVQPNFAGFEIEDVLYLIVPIAWSDTLDTLLTLAAIGAPAYLLWQLFAARRMGSRPAGWK